MKQRVKWMLLALLGVLALPQPARAQSGDEQRLVVWMRSGERVYFDLEEQPETTFEDGQLVIKTSKTTVFYQLENVLRYTYEGLMTAIESPKARPGEVVFRQGTDQMKFDGLPEGTRLEIYTLDGKLLGTQTARSGETTTVSLSNQPAGTYIVRAGDASYKFIKR